MRSLVLQFGISYRDLEEMTGEHGVAIDHTTLFRWVQHFAPLIEKRIRWYQRYTDEPWRVDETYMTVAGQWAYALPRDRQERRPHRFHVVAAQDTISTRRFLGNALRLRQDRINKAYGKALRAL